MVILCLQEISICQRYPFKIKYKQRSKITRHTSQSCFLHQLVHTNSLSTLSQLSSLYRIHVNHELV